MATALLTQPQWGSGACAHKHIQALKYQDVPHVYVVLLFHLRGMDYREG